ncbi:hexameric tyrosine-coordinated heme protein [Pseudoxanthomonas koreensis]|uniref:hexameric tyrosine-coordinated heme protein n=1 Tax=Pseudoxanthomonas koreensis TaxID=266061 RepID=UPI0035A5BEED
MIRPFLLTLALLAPAATMAAEPAAPAADYMPSLITDTPLQGRQLAITMVRKTIGSIQRDDAAKKRVREKYAEDPELLMHAAELVAIEFRTIAEANDYWRARAPAGKEDATR